MFHMLSIGLLMQFQIGKNSLNNTMLIVNIQTFSYKLVTKTTVSETFFDWSTIQLCLELSYIKHDCWNVDDLRPTTMEFPSASGFWET